MNAEFGPRTGCLSSADRLAGYPASVDEDKPTSSTGGITGEKRLSRNVKVASAVSFFQDAASDLLFPVIPLFITVVLGASPAMLGLIEGIAEGTASVTKAVSGRMADGMKRKPLIFLGYSLSALAKPLIGIATGWPLVLAARFSDRVGKGIRSSPRDALIAADTPQRFRGAAFGFHRAADSAGAVLGPLIGLAAFEYMKNVRRMSFERSLRSLFLIAFIPALVSVSLIMFLREKKVEPASTTSKPHAHRLTARYWRVVAFVGVFGLVNFSDTFLLLRARELNFSLPKLMLLYALFNLVYSSVSFPAGRIADRWPKRVVFGIGLLFFAGTYVGLAMIHSAIWVWVLFAGYGLYWALTDGVGKAWVANMLPSESLGTGLGMFHGILGGAVLIASLWAGAFWGKDGHVPLLVAGVVAGFLGILILVVGGRLDVDS